MVNRPPYDRDPPPPPGGFDPRFGSGRGPGRPEGSSFGGRPIHSYDDDGRAGIGPGDPRDPRDPYERAPDPFERRAAPPPPPPPVRRGMARSTMILLGVGALLLLAAIAFGLSLGRAGPGEDALGGEKGSTKEAAADPEARCAAPATYDKLKRELFRQAAAQRGADLAAFDRLAGYAALRVTSPVLREEDEGLEQVSCEADVALDLPPGVQVVGGRRSLSASLGYTLQPAADGSGDVVTLTGAEGITTPLATLARIGGATSAAGQTPPPAEATETDSLGQPVESSPPVAPAPPEQSRPAPAPDRAPPPPPEPAPPPPAPPQVTAQRTTSANPSFNCARASNRAERAICGNSGLASLDRQMASRFFAARREANTTQRVLLDRTRGSFLAFRNRCGSDACIAGAYRDRIREINDIMADRWVAPR